DVNAYLRDASGEEFTAKDFRTWAGTVLTASYLRNAPGAEANPKRSVARAIETVAARLGNTATICRKCYVHPGIVDAHLNGTRRRVTKLARPATAGSGLAPEEAAILPLLRAPRIRPCTPTGAPGRVVRLRPTDGSSAQPAPGAGRAART